MPELPDLTVYLDAIRKRLVGHPLGAFRLTSPFLVRTAEPPVSSLVGRTLRDVSLIGKRIVFDFGDELYAVVHLMIAGRFHWKTRGGKAPGKIGLAAFDFDAGTLLLTEASTKKRASLHVIQGKANLVALDPGGIDPLHSTAAAFTAALVRENHTLKRTLTDPTVFAGIGNSYSDEILHRARLSPFKQTQTLEPPEVDALRDATRSVLKEWIGRLRKETGDAFPEKVTAFRPDMAVHGKFGQACPVCATPVQRIVYAENEANYCPTCQTGGKLLADRALSRLLKDDWPKSLEELERKRAASAQTVRGA